jgi:hypothetical protein
VEFFQTHLKVLKIFSTAREPEDRLRLLLACPFVLDEEGIIKA